MSASVATKPFDAALAKVKGAVPTRTTTPILSCVRLAIADGWMTLAATDLDMLVEVSLPAEGALAPLCIEAARLGSVLARLKERAEVGLAAEPGALVVASGRSRLRLAALDAADWPSIEEPVTPHRFRLEAGEFLPIFPAMATAISREETRYYLNGIFLSAGAVDAEKGRAGGRLLAVATDGHKLSARDIAAPGIPTDMPAIIVPRETCALIPRLFAGAGAIEIGVSDKRITLATAETRLVSKLIDGTFPDWRRVTPNRAPSVSYDAAELSAAVATAASAVDIGKSGKGIRLSIGALETECVAREQGGSEGQDVVRHSLLAEPGATEIGVNADYLIELLAALDADTAELAITDAASPIVITAAARDDRKIVLMPMRV